MDRLTCIECGHENEPERVYCHNCGAKLDHALLPKKVKEKKPTKVDPKKAKHRIKVRQPVLKPLLISLLISMLLAALLLAVLPPQDAPDLDPPPLLNSPDIGVDLISLSTTSRSTFVSYTEEQVNSYLRTAIRASRKEKQRYVFKYVGSFVSFDEDQVRLTLVESVYGYPIYIHKTVSPVTTDSGLNATTVSCGFGRLDLPAIAAPVTDLFMNKVWKAAKRDLESLAKLGQAKAEEDLITLVSSP